jgi:hypothetical protein
MTKAFFPCIHEALKTVAEAYESEQETDKRGEFGLPKGWQRQVCMCMRKEKKGMVGSDCRMQWGFSTYLNLLKI